MGKQDMASSSTPTASTSSHSQDFQIIPKHVWYADLPPRLGGSPKKLSVPDFESKFPDFRLVEGWDTSSLTPSDKESLMTLDPNCIIQSQPNKFESTIHSLNDNIMIAKIPDFGHGIFTRSKIPQGSIVLFYSGKVISKKNNSSPSIFDFTLRNLTISPEKVGGLARFTNHAPLFLDSEIISLSLARWNSTFRSNLIPSWITKKSSPKTGIKSSFTFSRKKNVNTPFDESTKELVARNNQYDLHPDLCSANLEMYSIKVGNRIFRCLVAVRDIDIHEQLLWYYGNYFESRGLNSGLFDKDGKFYQNALSGKPWKLHIYFPDPKISQKKLLIPLGESFRKLITSKSHPVPVTLSAPSICSVYLRNYLAEIGFLPPKWAYPKDLTIYEFLSIFKIASITGVLDVKVCITPEYGRSVVVYLTKRLYQETILAIAYLRSTMSLDMKCFCRTPSHIFCLATFPGCFSSYINILENPSYPKSDPLLPNEDYYIAYHCGKIQKKSLFFGDFDEMVINSIPADNDLYERFRSESSTVINHAFREARKKLGISI